MTKNQLNTLEQLLRDFRSLVDNETAELICRARSNQSATKYWDHVSPQLDKIDEVIRHVHAKQLNAR